MSRRLNGFKFKRIIFVVFALFLIVGCSPSENQTVDERTKIRFSTWDSEENLDQQQELVDMFNESQDEIEVILEAYGSEYDTKISAGMGAGDAPDVMYMWNYPHYYEALEPLDSYIENEGDEYKDNFYETLWPYNAIEDDIYGIPVGFTTHVVFYNKDLFDDFGVSYPEPGWTWDDLRDIAEELSDENQNTFGLAIPGKPDPYDFEMYLWTNDAAYVDADGDLPNGLGSPKSVEVLKDFQDMLKNGSAVATEGSGTTEMQMGQIGMYVNGSWVLNDLTDAEINYGVVEIPKSDNHDGVSVLSSSGLAMSKDSKHKEEAFEFIKFWTNEASNESRLDYELPVLKSVVDKHELAEDEIKGVFYTMLEKSEGFTPTSFKIKDWSKLSSELSLVFEKIFNMSSLEEPSEVIEEVINNME